MLCSRRNCWNSCATGGGRRGRRSGSFPARTRSIRSPPISSIGPSPPPRLWPGHLQAHLAAHAAAQLRYLARRPSICPSDHVFLRNIAPFRPFRNGDGVSSVVKRLMRRAGVVAPVKGAHVLRHTAATEMLRHGVPLEKIGLVLRHRGVDTTARYAKADVALLKQIAQPWPEVL